MNENKRFTHNGIVIVDHLKKDLIDIDCDENLLDLAEYVDRLQYENEQLKKENEHLKIRFKEERDTAMKLGSECDNLTIKNQKLELEIIRLETIIKSGEKYD